MDAKEATTIRFARFGIACAGLVLLAAAASGSSPERVLRPDPASIARPDPEPVLRLHVLPIRAPSGGGDAILVADSSGDRPRHVLIDAGHDDTAAGALAAAGIDTLDLLVLTHAHHDHYGGIPGVLDAVAVRTFAFNGQTRSAVTYLRMLERVDRDVPQVIVVDSLRTVRLGPSSDATAVVLLPPMHEYLDRDTDRSEPLNDGSLGIRVQRAEFAFLTTGDAERPANRRFAREFAERVDVDVLKLGHHGSSDATHPFWLDAVSPRVAVVSANGTTHPHGSVLRMVESRGIEIYCTPQHGTVTVEVAADGSFGVRTSMDERRRCAPGSRR